MLEDVYGEYDHFFFTFKSEVATELSKGHHVRTISNVSRFNPFTWVKAAVCSAKIYFEERPDIVISTGAGVVFFLCVWAKLFGCRIIFIESLARVTKPTLTGRLLYPFADLFLVQWEPLLKYFPKAVYRGRLL
jgi:UDP-N-acetylglucosamine:LPS N-acetylglucosamine transferase